MDNKRSQNLFGVEFDPLYSEIEATLAQQDESGDPLSMPTEPLKINWRLIAEQASKLLEQCYDLRVVLWLIRANMHREGILALFQGLTKLDEIITKNQLIIYPTAEDEPINSGHAAALGWLSTPQCIAELKSARLMIDHPYSVQELINPEPLNNESGRFTVTSSAQLLTINTYFQQNGHPSLVEQFIAIEKAIKRIESHTNQYSEGYQLNCNQLCIFMAKNIALLSQSNKLNNSGTAHCDQMTASSASPEKLTQYVDDMPLRSRQEIILMLDRILEYFQHFEPSHPAPIFIRRTKQTIGMDFISIVEDLLPDSLNTLQQFTGK